MKLGFGMMKNILLHKKTFQELTTDELYELLRVRGKGYGKQIMLHAIDAAIEHFGATLIDIEAQEYAKGFYESVGFRQSSDTFMLDGIPHIRMTLKIEE